jgi:hypothetical protein
MELVERYLQAVRFLLPKKQQNDVDRELSEDIRAQIEEKEAELGRPIGEDELTTLLRKFGHPVLLALRYQQDRYLIGPAVFPLYWYAIKIVLGVLAVVHLLLPIIFLLLSQEPVDKIVALFLRFPSVLVSALAWTTLGFALIDSRIVRSALERSLSSWNPKSLPPVVKEEPVRPPSVVGFVVTALLTCYWLVGLRWFPHLLMGPVADSIAFGPVFHRLYVPMALAGGISIALGWIRISRPHWTRFQWMSELVVDAMGLVVVYLLSKGGDLFVAREGMARLPQADRLLELVNLVGRLGLTVAVVVGVVVLATKYVRYARVFPWHTGPVPPRST